jgi:tetratricopeptide (TPR) repeat protein
VRALHPDACSGPEFEDLQQKRAEVFVRVRQAFEVIGDLQARAAYDTHLKLWNRNSAPPLERPNASARAEASGPCAAPEAPGELAPGPRDLALASLTSAEARFEAGQYWDVIQALEPLLPRFESGLRARARCLLARAYAKNPKWQHRAEEALRLVIEEDPNHVGAHLLLAQIYAAAGLTALARGMYRKVLALDPRNAEARAAAQMPEGDPPPHTQAPSTLKHLFRRN